VAYQAVDIESLAQSQVITDLLSAARAYLSPNDKTAWFALLRGPWCGLTLAEMQALVEVSAQPWVALSSLDNIEFTQRFSALTLSNSNTFTQFSAAFTLIGIVTAGRTPCADWFLVWEKPTFSLEANRGLWRCL